MTDLIDRLSERLDHLAETAHAHRDIEAVIAAHPSHRSAPRPSSSRPKRRVIMRIAAASIILIGVGAVAFVRFERAESPADQPPVARLEPIRDDRATDPVDFPVLGEVDGLDSVEPGVMRWPDDTPRTLRAVLGRIVGDRYEDIVQVEVNVGTTSPWPDDATRTPVTVSGVEVTRVEVPGQGQQPDAVVYVWESGGSTISITDSPMSAPLVEALVASVGADGLPTIDTDHLVTRIPDGFEILDGPTIELADLAPTIDAVSTARPAEYVVLHVWPTLLFSGPSWTVVSVDGERGFLVEHESNGTAKLAWPTPDGAWATLYGSGAMADRLVEIAEAVTWVDADTWMETYDTDFPPTDDGEPPIDDGFEQSSDESVFVDP